MKVTKLEIDYQFDFLIFGLIAPLKEHRVAWILNSLLRIDLEATSDLGMEFKNKSKLRFSQYLFQTDYVTFRLLKNKAVESEKTTKPFLLPELKEYDYFLIVDGDEDILGRQVLKQPLKDCSYFTYVEEFDANMLKSKENLIF